MFVLFLFFIALTITGILVFVGFKIEEDEFAIVSGVIGGLISGIALLLLLAIFGFGYYGQIKDIENVHRVEANKIIYVNRAEDLTNRFKDLLSVQYPNYEKSVFDKITSQNPEVLFVAYPQLRAIEGLNKLVDQIRSLRGKIYAQDIEINDYLKRIRVRKRDIMQLGFWYPDS